ncbi:MAG: response regulator, partial [Thermodesulfovibrionales bacterium]|nr:response regulator [Thermodesulfovibrionales bacterium]
GNGKEAVQRLENSRFDFILCDWEMPEMSGSELLQWIRNNPATKAMYFIMVTARNERDYVLEAIKLGVNDYVVKPPTGEVLLQRIKAALQRVERK